MRIFPIRAARSLARSGVFLGRGGCGEGPVHHPGNPKGKSAKLKARRWPSRGEATDGRRNITLEDGKGASFANFNAVLMHSEITSKFYHMLRPAFRTAVAFFNVQIRFAEWSRGCNLFRSGTALRAAEHR